MQYRALPLLVALAAAEPSPPDGVGRQLRRTPALAALGFSGADAAKASSGIPTVRHDKDPGEGYNKGSPLYAKQQQMKEDGTLPGSSGKKKGKDKCFLNLILRSWASNKEGKCWEDVIGVKTDTTWLENIVAAVSFLVLFAIFAFLYQKLRPQDGQLEGKIFCFNKLEARFPPQDNFQYGLCECRDCGSRETLSLCVIGYCCPLIRWADTVSQARALNYWAGIGILAVLVTLGIAFYPYGEGIVFLVLFGVQFFYRQKLHQIFHADKGGYKGGAVGYCFDAFAWCCCPCCATIQEAREVETVSRAFA